MGALLVNALLFAAGEKQSPVAVDLLFVVGRVLG